LNSRWTSNKEWSWQLLKFKKMEIDSVENWPSSPDWEGEVLQLSSGPLGHVLRIFSMPSLTVEWNTIAARTLFRERFGKDMFCFALQTDGAGPVRYLGQDLAPRDMMIFSPEGEQDHEYVAQGAVSALWIIVPAQTANLRLWSRKLPRTQEISAPDYSRILKVCGIITRTTARRMPQTDRLEENVLETIELALGPALFRPADELENLPEAIILERKFRLFLQKRHYNEAPRIADITDHLKVSRRTLFRTLESWPGATPAKYSKTIRLHASRQDLLRALSSQKNVSDIALDNGFFHFGRFSKDYHSLFGEFPKETIRKHR
jgi:AraC family ethanolamine operon transcriptional activator